MKGRQSPVATRDGRSDNPARNALATAIPSNLVSRRDLADTYEAVGKYYENRDWPQARAWHQKSLDIWTAWPQFTHSGRMDQARRIKAADAVARCERRLGSKP
jgi:hypothetical protein